MQHAVTVGITSRDRAILEALDRCPLTVRHLLQLSETFAEPFTSLRRVQERLHTLAARGLLFPVTYYLPTHGKSSYYVRTLEGWRALTENDELRLPSRASCEPLSHSRLPHWQALADFLVHTFCAAHRAGIPLTDFHPENGLRIDVAGQSRYPDSTFRLHRLDDGKSFPYFIELDNATQPVYSDAPGSWQSKILFYEACRDSFRETGGDDSFRVLILTTGGTERVKNILEAAAFFMRRKERSIFYGMPLAVYLKVQAPLTERMFLDNLGRVISLVPPARKVLSTTARAAAAGLAKAGSLC